MTDIRLEIAKCGSVWAMLPAAFDALAHAGPLSAPEAAKRLPTVVGAIAVVPVYGPITQRGGWFATSADAIGDAILAAVANPAVGAVVMDIDSPGGSVFGINELGSLIRTARETKPIIAVANSMAASAAYHIAASASTVVVTPGGQVGSIGVLMLHEDVSQAAEKMGFRYTYVSAGKYKVEGNPFEPLGEEAQEEFQREVDRYYAAFVGSVAAGRGVSVAKVERDFGQGRMLGAEAAVSAGMADQVGTLRDVLGGLARSAKSRQRRAAAERQLRVANA